MLISRSGHWIDAMALQKLLYYARKDQDPDGIPLSDAASDLIDLVLLTYGSMSSDELRALTHIETPWAGGSRRPTT